MRLIGLAVVLAVSLLLSSLGAAKAQPRNIPRVGVISAATPEADGPWTEAFHEGLYALGYIEGRNVAIEWRHANGRAERFQELAEDLVHLKVDVIVTSNQPGLEAAHKTTRTIPIVMILTAQDPVRRGFVASLARPGGNITGFSPQTYELMAKRLQLLLEAVPKVSRMVLLWDPAFVGIEDQVRATEDGARALGIQLQLAGVRSPSEFDTAFTLMRQQRAQAIMVLGSSMHYLHRARIAELAAKSGLPSGCFLREFAEAGCLMSYAPSFRDLWRRSAVYIDKILRGAKPGDLPVEQPTKFEFVINLKTAKSLGLTIPHTLLLRADEVIE